MRHPEPNKKPGVSYAVTDDGYELPVIDVTHPAFATLPAPETFARLKAKYGAEVKLRSYLPGFVRRRLVRFIVGRSALLQAAMAERLERSSAKSGEAFMGGIATYLMKLGAPNLGAAWALPMDRKLSQTYPPQALRLRLEETALLLAEGLIAGLHSRPGAPLELVTIGGGPGMEALNALLKVERERPSLLAGRRVRIHVFDRDAAGPRFGIRALGALRAAGRLAEMNVSMAHVPYDWTHPSTLAAALEQWRGETPFIAVSSEGALFDYATPEVVIATLQTLRQHAPPDLLLVGDYVEDTEQHRLEAKETVLSIQLYRPDEFGSLVARAGFRVVASAPALPEVVRLAPIDNQ